MGFLDDESFMDLEESVLLKIKDFFDLLISNEMMKIKWNNSLNKLDLFFCGFYLLFVLSFRVGV